MAAEDNLSRELFFDAHRGIRLKSWNNFKINKENLGMHWSADQAIAKQFGGINYIPEDTRVVHAKIPMSSVETDASRLKERDVTSVDHFEKEIPVKDNAPVLVTGISKFKEVYGQGRDGNMIKTKSRTRTYNPPREMKA